MSGIWDNLPKGYIRVLSSTERYNCGVAATMALVLDGVRDLPIHFRTGEVPVDARHSVAPEDAKYVEYWRSPFPQTSEGVYVAVTADGRRGCPFGVITNKRVTDML